MAWKSLPSDCSASRLEAMDPQAHPINGTRRREAMDSGVQLCEHQPGEATLPLQPPRLQPEAARRAGSRLRRSVGAR